jgi:hypothetical protein
MRTPARPVLPILFAALLAAACSGNSPPPPNVAVAGWSWDPAEASDRPLPVIWWNSATPEPLPLVEGSDCPSGSAHAMMILDGVAMVAGYQAFCTGTAFPRMRPVVWARDTAGTFLVQALPLPDRASQATALAVDVRTNSAGGVDVFVGGAAGVESPYPMVWKNGMPFLAIAGEALPAGYDSGIVTSIQTGQNFIAAGGVMHAVAVAGSPPVYRGVVWILDPDFTTVIPIPLDLPDGVAGADFGPSVPIVVTAESLVFAAASIASSPGQDKPLVWMDKVTVEPLGLDFTVGPYGVPTGFRELSGTPYLSGYERSVDGLPAPAVWTATAQQALSTVDPSLGLGAGEAIALLYEHAYVAGETYKGGASPGAPMVSVAAWWDNGSRHDLQGIVAAGAGPVLSQPLFGWWRLPGTPLTDPPNWPYPGGFAEIDAAPARVAAAGSAVAKAILVFPK